MRNADVSMYAAKRNGGFASRDAGILVDQLAEDCEHLAELSLYEDGHSIGDLGSDRADESFDKRIRL